MRPLRSVKQIKTLTYLLTYLLTTHLKRKQQHTHLDRMMMKTLLPSIPNPETERLLTYLLTDHHMSDFTSGGELDLSEKEQSTKSRTASETASQPVSDIPQDVGNNNWNRICSLVEEYRCTYCESKAHLYAPNPMFTSSFISSFMVYSLISSFVLSLDIFVMASKDSSWPPKIRHG